MANSNKFSEVLSNYLDNLYNRHKIIVLVYEYLNYSFSISISETSINFHNINKSLIISILT